MAEYIERQQVLDIVSYAMLGSCNQNFTLQKIHSLPAADVAPLVHGWWIPKDYMIPHSSCSVCGSEVRTDDYGDTSYCPWCGAKMDIKD